MFWVFWDHYLNDETKSQPRERHTTSRAQRPPHTPLLSPSLPRERKPSTNRYRAPQNPAFDLVAALRREQEFVESVFSNEIPREEYGIFEEQFLAERREAEPFNAEAAQHDDVQPVPFTAHEGTDESELEITTLVEVALPAQEAGIPAHQKYDYITAFSNEALCVFNEHGDCGYLSPNWQRITGYDVSDCMGDSLIRHIHPEHQHKIREKLAELDTADATQEMRTKCQLMHADGSMQWYDVAFAARQEKAEGSKEYICVFRNIHQDVVAQKTLHKAKLEAELALRARSEFLANMSHELRTPLNAIIGFAQVMNSRMFGEINNDKYEEYITNIQESGYNLLSKINDLLEIANLDSGRIKLSEETFDMMELIRHVIQIHSHHAFTSHVTIREQLFKDPLMVRADRVKMQQVLSNVLSNAMRYNREGGFVTITARYDVNENLVISVKDSGVGIAPGQLSNIVDAFKHKDSFFSRELSGIGLGLALVKEFVILHGGQFSIDSKAGKGTTVYITLPSDRVVRQSLTLADILGKPEVVDRFQFSSIASTRADDGNLLELCKRETLPVKQVTENARTLETAEESDQEKQAV